MKMFGIILAISILGLIGYTSKSRSDEAKNIEGHKQEKEVGHDHDNEKGHEHAEEGAGHGEKGHEHAEEGHGHDEEERRNVGPDKGVLDANEELGFKLRAGVEERFGITTQMVHSTSLTLPRGAIVYSKEEYEVFRKRNDYWKALDVEITRKADSVLIKSHELKAGDSVAIKGVGFLKIVELSVFGPAIEGHIH